MKHLFRLILVGLTCELLAAIVYPSETVERDLLGRRGGRVYGTSAGRCSDVVYPQQGEGTVAFTYPYHFFINSLGLRGAEPASHGRKDRARILVLGNSQIFGMLVGEEETFSARLQQLLNQPSDRYEVLNGGIPAAGTFEAHCKLGRLLEQAKPDLVILGVFADNLLLFPGSGNDLCANLCLLKPKDPRCAPAPQDFLTRHSHLYGVWRTMIRLLAEPSYFAKARAYQRVREQDPELGEIWQKTRAELADMAELSRRSGSRFAILYIPGLASLALDDSTSLEELHKTGLPVISAFESLKRAANGDLRRLRFRRDAHYNALAHRAIAEALFPFVRSVEAPRMASLRTDPEKSLFQR